MSPLHLLWILPLTALISFCTGGLMTFGMAEDDADVERERWTGLLEEERRKGFAEGLQAAGRGDPDAADEIMDVDYYRDRQCSGLYESD